MMIAFLDTVYFFIPSLENKARDLVREIAKSTVTLPTLGSSKLLKSIMKNRKEHFEEQSHLNLSEVGFLATILAKQMDQIVMIRG
ncbi:hypothetical protein SUGI_0364540 [Cryptomeria japonica]|nr:hypothetical protein SUGI_0364540 [Cryptomeria japonica]